MLHRTRHLFIRQQTAVINAIRAQLAELGVVAPVGRRGIDQLLAIVADPSDKRLPELARICVAALGAQLQTLKLRILEFDRLIRAWHRSNEVSRRLDRIPGVGPALATALVASIPDPKVFRSGRDFSAWIGLVPKQNSSGGKDRLGNISKRGTAICVVSSRPELSPSFAMPRSTARDIGPGSRRFWRGGPPRSLPLRSPISSQGWPGQ
jgi:transposase